MCHLPVLLVMSAAEYMLVTYGKLLARINVLGSGQRGIHCCELCD